MTDTTVDMLSRQAQAPMEPGVSVSTPFNMQINWNVTAGSGKTIAINKPVEDLLGAYLSGMSRVHMVEMRVKYVFTAEKQWIKVATASVNNSAGIDSLIAAPNNFSVRSSVPMIGIQHEKIISVSGNFSRQIIPASSDLPRFKLMLTAHADVEVYLSIDLYFVGHIIKYDTLN